MSSAREQIIEATCQLIEVQGYHATGLNQIISESGSPKGSLYYYFPGGKEELVTEAIRHTGEALKNHIQAQLALKDDPAEAIADFMKQIALNVEKEAYQTGGPITSVAMESIATSETLRSVCNEVYQSCQAVFAEKLMMSGLPPDQAASLGVLIVSSIEGAVILCRTSQSPEPLNSVADHLAEWIKVLIQAQTH
ncbi:transcriptional regulator YxaF [Anaerolineales bacterium]